MLTNLDLPPEEKLSSFSGTRRRHVVIIIRSRRPSSVVISSSSAAVRSSLLVCVSARARPLIRSSTTPLPAACFRLQTYRLSGFSMGSYSS